jgi:hypothetical protein
MARPVLKLLKIGTGLQHQIRAGRKIKITHVS